MKAGPVQVWNVMEVEKEIFSGLEKSWNFYFCANSPGKKSHGNQQ